MLLLLPNLKALAWSFLGFIHKPDISIPGEKETQCSLDFHEEKVTLK